MSDWINDRTPRNAASSGLPLSWRVVVPVKGGPQAKSRLRAPEGVDRLVLARALALDTVAAACAAVGSDRVTVVTSDPEMDHEAHALGVSIQADPGAGLNAAIAEGVAQQAHDAVAVLLGDVPALHAAELSAALLAAAGHDCAFVPDTESTGTVLLAARSPRLMLPRFGNGSAAAHEQAGAVRLDLALPGLRRDVDDEASLRAALGLGVGAHTAALLAHLVAPAG